jgi:hypothetical protein
MLVSTGVDKIRNDALLRGTGGVSLSEPFRNLSGEFCSLNSPSTCSIFNRTSALSSETFGGSEFDCAISIFPFSYRDEYCHSEAVLG